jgi:hypothetical protein
MWLKAKNSTVGVLSKTKYIEIPLDMAQNLHETPTGDDP